MTTDLIEQLKGGPALEPATDDPFAGAPPVKAAGRPGRKPVTPARQQRRDARAGRMPFAEVAPHAGPAGDSPTVGDAVFTEEHAAQLRVLWDEYLQKQREVTGPKTMSYRCMGFKGDGTLCGVVVEAGTLEERLKTGEVIRCPHGPDSRDDGVLFDRERFPQHHHELTPMEPIQ